VAAAFGLALEIFGVAAAASLVVSLVVAIAVRLVAGRREVGRFVFPIAAALGFAAGYSLLPRDFAVWQPESSRPWTWLPYGAAVAALIAVGFQCIPAPRVRMLADVPLAIVAAFCLTPTWEVAGMKPVFMSCVLLGYLLLVGAGFTLLAGKLPPRVVVGAMALAGLLLAIAAGVMVSTRFAQLAAISGAGLGGACAAGCFRGKADEMSAVGVVPVYVILVGGVAWIACVEPDPPQWALLLVPLLPFAFGPIAMVASRTLKARQEPRPP
jgi:hypothetical protein